MGDPSGLRPGVIRICELRRLIVVITFTNRVTNDIIFGRAIAKAIAPVWTSPCHHDRGRNRTEGAPYSGVTVMTPRALVTTGIAPHSWEFTKHMVPFLLMFSSCLAHSGG